MAIEISIAVLPVVKKYIAHRYNVEPFVLSRTNFYGIFLESSLQQLKGPHLVAPDLDPKVYTEKLRLEMGDFTLREHGWYIHPQKQFTFNQMVKQLMYHEMCFFMDCKTSIKKERIYQSFYAFREKLALTEDDLKLKTMEKRYERYRAEINASLSA